ncbi:general stress protein [Bacillus sp. FJAT-42376]|uniref:pyridoxamine 5'-phosphate oxidase family protein n=1 Tax=Bacillus sp. FJAT-42376 TaxID=2014076 RepID=UPI000F4F0A69|nr:pyridoxamine 5'-phosphate oxidase family protein [Bacillus sp. FJAT-42376]AZB41676.1 general stress protein [Bacillus sp. FJAT-42376]
MSNHLEAKIIKLLDNHQIGSMATVRNSKPYSRFMLFFHEGLTLYTATSKKTHKAEDINENPSVHLLLGYEGKGFQDEYAEVEAKASVEESASLKEKFWNEKLKDWIKGPDDPDFMLLKLEPEKFCYYAKAGDDPETLEMK